MVSDDKVEVDLPDITAFMNVSGRVIDTQAETLSSSNLVCLPTPATGSNSVTAGITHPNPNINLPALTGQRNMVGSTEHSSAAESPSAKLSTTNFLSLGPIYRIKEVSKNKQLLDVTKMPNAILQMEYLKLYIPLSMWHMKSQQDLLTGSYQLSCTDWTLRSTHWNRQLTQHKTW